MNKSKFGLGQIVITAGVAEEMDRDPVFYRFVTESLERYKQCDWGDTCENDKKSVLAIYIQPKTDTKLWIITEWDRSVTTILFPHEY